MGEETDEAPMLKGPACRRATRFSRAGQRDHERRERSLIVEQKSWNIQGIDEGPEDGDAGVTSQRARPHSLCGHGTRSRQWTSASRRTSTTSRNRSKAPRCGNIRTGGALELKARMPLGMEQVDLDVQDNGGLNAMSRS